MMQSKCDVLAAEPVSIGMLLIDGFSLMSYASIIEPFRAANDLAGRTLYVWTHVSPAGGTVRASNGASLVAERHIGEVAEFDLLFVFAAGDPAVIEDRALFAWLRRLATAGVRIAGISGGPYVLARAGLLDGYSATIHWEHQVAFAERFPAVALDAGLYVIDRRRLTCAGGTAGLDLAIELIEREHGHALAARVGEWFIRTEHRSADRPQRPGLRERHGLRDDRLLKVIAHMEASVEEPAPREALARLAGLSVRQLERLFRGQLDRGVHDVYRAIRLDQARELLRKTNLPITQIALACGFQGSSHFSATFRQAFGVAPRGWRQGEDAPVR
jgi:transcriptional regulator GlxA family with amidase domain